MLPTVVGEFTAVTDPELRFTPSGVAVANFRAAANSRKKTESGEWVDDKSCFLNVTVWKKAAENVAESVVKGTKVTIKGRLETRNYETKEGEKRTSYDLTADEIGVSIAFDPVKVMKAERTAPGEPAEDPWASTGGSDEPPF
jgi:single-strand DNA-binding protein